MVGGSMKDKNGFTLVEILAVISILAIIIVIAMPKINSTISKNSNQMFLVSAKNVIRQLEYSNEDFTREYLMDLDLGDISIDNFDIATSEAYMMDDEIYLNLVGSGTYEGKYLCNVNSSTEEANVQTTSCDAVSFITVTLDPNGGTLTNTTKQVVYHGVYGTLPTPTRDGYTFKGWKNILYFSSEEKTRNWSATKPEFMQYVDFAPYFDLYGVDKTYHLELDLKSEDVTNKNSIVIYFQNGSATKYKFTRNISYTVSTDWLHVGFDFNVSLESTSETKAMLAFYGIYDSGNVPIVKNVELSLLPNVISDTKVVQNGNHTLTAIWEEN